MGLVWFMIHQSGYEAMNAELRELLGDNELDVVGLVTEGLGNKDIAARLFVSPRTVQAHLTPVYTKLGITSRFQLIQETAAHAD
ncbi:MAG: helix-turn-helix transcriptional regulator [Mycobacteriaceae bacterium]|nr:helix-turn-helix transcriptional regulator [Mycobacteriaceae bacterium]